MYGINLEFAAFGDNAHQKTACADMPFFLSLFMFCDAGQSNYAAGASASAPALR